MKKDSPKPILKFEPGSRQPFILYLISITIISAIIVIVCLFTSGMTFSDKKADALGDVNLDGKVDTADVTLLSQYFTGGAQLTDEQKEIADVDNNGEINSKDTMLIMQHIGVHSSEEDKPDKEQPSQSTEAPQKEEPSSEPSSEAEEPDGTQPEEKEEPEVNSDFVSSGKSENAAFLTAESGAYYIARIGNSWQSGDGKYMYQIDFTVKNNSQKTIYNTSAKVNLSGGVNVEKNWDCSAKNETGVITVTTKNEGRLLPGGTFTCGFVISASSPITIESVTK